MTDHDAYHELLALRLYDELDADETARLDAHLAGCTACTRYADELARGLGAVRERETRRASDDLPTGWTERLRAPTSGPRPAPTPRPRRVAALAFAAGLAAGIVLVLSVRPTPETSPHAVETTTSPTMGATQLARTTHLSNAAPASPFASRATPPPRTTSRGPLGQLGTLLGR